MTEADCKTRILQHITAKPVSLEGLALLCGAGRKVEVIEVEDVFRDAVWSLLDAHLIDWDWDRGLRKIP
jgi:hypothetical protein